MLTLFDQLPSQNAWQACQLLHHLGQPYHKVPVSIFRARATARSIGEPVPPARCRRSG
ncbi:hypothetical protein UUA_15368 [Rhodanobacter thiooxydans LCS2]|nr:hypothetical protein UUA_15368 [Rhodanobacter thiooxydans LCS2]